MAWHRVRRVRSRHAVSTAAATTAATQPAYIRLSQQREPIMNIVERQTRQWAADLRPFAARRPEADPRRAAACRTGRCFPTCCAELAVKPEEEALISGPERWTWRELDGAATNLARNFLSLGLKPGDRVASLMPNRPVLIDSLHRLHEGGAGGVPLNYRYTAAGHRACAGAERRLDAGSPWRAAGGAGCEPCGPSSAPWHRHSRGRRLAPPKAGEH